MFDTKQGDTKIEAKYVGRKRLNEENILSLVIFRFPERVTKCKFQIMP